MFHHHHKKKKKGPGSSLETCSLSSPLMKEKKKKKEEITTSLSSPLSTQTQRESKDDNPELVERTQRRRDIILGACEREFFAKCQSLKEYRTNTDTNNNTNTDTDTKTNNALIHTTNIHLKEVLSFLSDENDDKSDQESESDDEDEEEKEEGQQGEYQVGMGGYENVSGYDNLSGYDSISDAAESMANGDSSRIRTLTVANQIQSFIRHRQEQEQQQQQQQQQHQHQPQQLQPQPILTKSSQSIHTYLLASTPTPPANPPTPPQFSKINRPSSLRCIPHRSASPPPSNSSHFISSSVCFDSSNSHLSSNSSPRLSRHHSPCVTPPITPPFTPPASPSPSSKKTRSLAQTQSFKHLPNIPKKDPSFQITSYSDTIEKFPPPQPQNDIILESNSEEEIVSEEKDRFDDSFGELSSDDDSEEEDEEDEDEDDDNVVGVARNKKVRASMYMADAYCDFEPPQPSPKKEKKTKSPKKKSPREELEVPDCYVDQPILSSPPKKKIAPQEDFGVDCYLDQPILLTPSSPTLKKKTKKKKLKGESEERKLKKEEKKKEKERKAREKKLEGLRKDRSLRWCEAFHTVSSCLREGIKETLDCGTEDLDPSEVLSRQITEYWKLYQVSREFTNTAKHYGSIIISERYSEKKTINPINIGGVAGGEKYLAQGILFKFATAESGLYVNEHAAAKVAGHELKGCLTYFNCLTFLGRSNVRVPLIVLIDMFGYRLVAISLLPIGKGTLVYGTCDAGRNVFNSAPVFDSIMEDCGKNLNLEKHICGANADPERRQTLHTAADVEGHYGFDDRYYLVDFSRVLPPVVPNPKLPGSQLFQMFRQEFVTAYEQNPLCSDAFSGFTLYDPDRVGQNERIREATKNLIEMKIPDFARRLTWVLLEAREKGELVSFNLPQALHREGINLRYLGLILDQYVKDDREETLLSQYYVLTCILARTFKNEIRKILRNVLLKQKYADESTVRTTIISYLNLILLEKPPCDDEEETTAQRANYMKKTVIPLMKKWFLFAGGLPKGVKKPDVFIKLCHAGTPVLGTHPSVFVLSFIESQLSISFSKLASPKILINQPLSETDIFSISARVKHMNVVAAAMGGYCRNAAALYSSDHMRQTQDALELLRMGNKHYLEGLQSTPKNITLLRGAANCLLQLFVLEQLQKDDINRHVPHEVPFQFEYDEIDRTIVLNSKDPLVRQVDDYFREALDLTRESSLCCDYALFLWQCGRISKAEEFFLRSLEENPFNVRGLLTYADYLKKKDMTQIAETFTQRAKSLSMVSMLFLTTQTRQIGLPEEINESAVPFILSWSGLPAMDYKFCVCKKKNGVKKENDKENDKEQFLYFSSRTKVKRFLIDLAELFGEEEERGVAVTVGSEESTPTGEKGELMEDLFGKPWSPVFMIDQMQLLEWKLLTGNGEKVVEASTHFLGGVLGKGTLGRNFVGSERKKLFLGKGGQL